MKCQQFHMDFVHALVEIHAVVLNRRDANVGTWRQAPRALIGVLVSLDFFA